MTVKANPTDNLNELLNRETPNNEPLVVELPEKAVFNQQVSVNRSHVVIMANNSSVLDMTLLASDFIARDLVVCGTLKTDKESDNVAFDVCRFLGKKNTIVADGMKNLFLDCFIEGTDEIITGSGTANFHNCEIVSLDKGCVCVPETERDSKEGLCFFDCKFTSRGNVPDASVELVINPLAFFSECKFGKHIKSL